MAFFFKAKFLLLLCLLFLLSLNLVLAFQTEYDPEREERQRGRGSEEERGENPFLFDEHSFRTTIEEEEGSVRVLERFTRRSKVLRGIENFRVSFYEANPSTFTVPNHWDAESVSFVARGSGTMTLVQNDNRETFNIKRGDILRIPAGTIVYVVNKDKHKKLQIIDFVHAFSIPGQFETFFGPGGKQNPESFFRAFTTEILAAAFNLGSERVERLFGQEKKGVFLKASEKQIKELSKHASSSEGGLWPFGGGGRSSGPLNLFKKGPLFSNDFGQLYETKPDDFKQLQDLDVGVSFANISRGAMIGPYFNSRAAKVAIVLEGKGYYEMACPHYHRSTSDGQGRGRRSEESEGESEGERESGPHYHKFRGHLSPGVVFVAPAGHPLVTVASNDQNLEIVCFEVNAQQNERIMVAGKGNVIQQLEKEAKELSFGVKEREIDEVFNSQKESFFFPGPQQSRGEGRASA